MAMSTAPAAMKKYANPLIQALRVVVWSVIDVYRVV